MAALQYGQDLHAGIAGRPTCFGLGSGAVCPVALTDSEDPGAARLLHPAQRVNVDAACAIGCHISACAPHRRDQAASPQPHQYRSPSADLTASRFTGDRYQRLRRGADIVAHDPAVIDASPPFNSDGVLRFVRVLADRRLLDHVSERNADMVAMLILLDFHQGPAQGCARLERLVASCATAKVGEQDTLSVVSAFAGAVALMADTAAWTPGCSD